MGLTFDRIAEKLFQYNIDILSNHHTDLSLTEVQFIHSSAMKLDKNVLYISKASTIQESIHEYRDIGLLLIKDCPFNPSQLQVDTALFPDGTDLFELFNHVQNIFSYNRKLIDSSATLLHSLIKGKGLKYIVQVGSEILGNPVLLIDASTKLLASSNNTNVADSIWDEMTALGYGSKKCFSPYITEGFVEKIAKNQMPILIDSGAVNYLKRIVGKIVINHKVVGYIAVLENNQILKDEDVIMTGLLCDVIAAEMQKNKLYENRTGVMHEYLITDLLGDRIGNVQMVEERTKSLFCEPYNHFLVAAVNVPESNTNSHFIEHLRWSLESLHSSCKSVYYDEHIIILLNTKDNEQLQNVKNKLITILKENNLLAGLSLIFHNIMDTKKYYMQAKTSLKLGKLLKRKQYVFEYDDLYVYDLLMLGDSASRIKDFCHPGIDRLVEYDKTSSTDYYHTLYEYLLTGGNLTLAAKRLFIHRNTMVHRIAKIAEITGLNLNEGNNRFKLLLTYKIMELPI